LDPDFFEAHMNYAAVNLSFRGFEQAEAAYREALRLRPNEFEAHLGLALAIRGQISPANRDEKMPDAEKHLAEAKKIAANRPETYYNEAILTQEFKAKSQPDDDKSIAMMKVAIRQYEDFVAKAGSDSGFGDAVKRSKERIQDMRDTIKFLEEGKKSREAADRDAKEAAAKAAAKAKEDAAKPPPPPASDKDKAGKDTDKAGKDTDKAGKDADKAGKDKGGKDKAGAADSESKGDDATSEKDKSKDKKGAADAKKPDAAKK